MVTSAVREDGGEYYCEAVFTDMNETSNHYILQIKGDGTMIVMFRKWNITAPKFCPLKKTPLNFQNWHYRRLFVLLYLSYVN